MHFSIVKTGATTEPEIFSACKCVERKHFFQYTTLLVVLVIITLSYRAAVSDPPRRGSSNVNFK